MNVRLKTNLIVDGKLINRGTVLDDSTIPAHMRVEEYIAPDDGGGRALALHDLNFYTVRQAADGVTTSYPTMIAGGESVDLAELPESYRNSLKEGVDYQVGFTGEEQKALQARLHAAYLKQFQAEAEPAVTTGWRTF